MGKIRLLLLLLLGLIFLDFYLFKSYKDLKENIISRLIKSAKPKEKEIKLILLGDVMLGRSVMTKSLDLNDPVYPFRKVADKLRGADIVFANLESPLVDNCPKVNSGFKFCARPEMLEGLNFAGINVVSLANNHILNYGDNGLSQTKRLLTERGIGWVGFGELVVKEVGGVKFGFLGFDLTTKNLTDFDIKLIVAADRLSDVLIVGVHWGAEYQASPTNNQKLLAVDFVEAGADIIAGHHPHWVQGAECLSSGGVNRIPPVKIPPVGWNRQAPPSFSCPSGSKIVFYSLGNFVFDQMWSEETKKGIMIELTFRNKEIISLETSQIYIRDLGQPEIID